MYVYACVYTRHILRCQKYAQLLPGLKPPSSMQMYVYIFAYVLVCMYVCMYVSDCVCVYMSTNVCVCYELVSVYMNVMCVCMHAFMHACVHLCVPM